MKTCRKCRAEKSLSEFHRNRRSRDGHTDLCKPCACAHAKHHRDRNLEATRAKQREYARLHPEEALARTRAYAARDPEAVAARLRNWRLKRHYNFSLAEWEALFEAQGRACAACGSPDPKRAGPTGNWHTDHCHTTGKVRGILCHHCNLALGHVKDSPEALLSLYSYLTGRLPGV